MTKLETSLLDLLKEDCRIPLEKLAVMTGASLEEVASTIESLEKRRVILRYARSGTWGLTRSPGGSTVLTKSKAFS